MISLEALFKQVTGAAPVSVEALTGSASHRRYFRLTGPDGRTLIGVEGTDSDENRAFLTLDRHFATKGIRVPKVLAENGLCYLQEDLGSSILYDALSVGRASGNYGPEEVALLRKTLAALPKIQVEGARGLDWNVCYPQPSFDARMVDFDLNYFKYDFLKLSALEFNEVRLQDDFDRFREDRLAEPSDTFLYRDFNARNVMLVDGEPYFIDFQGGRKGPYYYDLTMPAVHPTRDAVAYVDHTATIEQRMAEVNAILRPVILSDRTVRIYALSLKPRVNIPIKITVGMMQMSETISLNSSWSGSGPWTKQVTLSSDVTDAIVGTCGTTTDAMAEEMTKCGIVVSGISGSTLTLTALFSKPTIALTMGVVYNETEVES